MKSTCNLHWISVSILACLLGVSVSAGEGLGVLGSDSLGVHTGFSVSDLNGRGDDYEVIPVVVRFGYDIDGWMAETLGIESGDWWFHLEPFFGQVVGPNNRIEIGCALMLRWAHGLGDLPLAMFIEGGAGPMYTTVETREQGTHFNFINYLGLGLAYGLDECLDIEMGVRYRHVSNAGMDSRNSGIDGCTGLVGLTHRF